LFPADELLRVFRSISLSLAFTNPRLSVTSIRKMRAFLVSKYDDYYAQSKVLDFAKGFLKYQAKLTLDPRYRAFDKYFGYAQGSENQKKMTSRVVTKEDIEHVLGVLKETIAARIN
jgi:hypothetical protein